MNVTARWNYSEEYFKSYWRDWIRTISKGRKWTLPMAAVLLVLGAILKVGLFHLPSYHEEAMAILFVFGIIQLVWHFFDKNRWLARMAEASKDSDETIVVFSEDSIQIKSPHSEGTMTWGAFKNVVASQNGLFLILHKGISIYVPDDALDIQNGKQEIQNMFKQHCA